MRLYRRVVGTPYTGPGSFWSPDPAVAERYGARGHGGRLITTEARGRVLKLESDEELVKALMMAGVRDAEDRVSENDWFESDDVREGLRRFGYAWIERLVDPSISWKDVEWIYVGKKPLHWK
jgi:hypothetical protein